MRAAFVASSLKRKPSLEEMVALVKDIHQWTPAEDIAKRILSIYKAPPSRTTKLAVKTFLTADNIDQLEQNIKDKSWTGLVVVHDLPHRGSGLSTTRDFDSGEVVCDYPGQLLNNKEGKARYNASAEGASGYMFQFTFDGHKYWVDATEETCDVGRMINHSPCCFNVSLT